MLKKIYLFCLILSLFSIQAIAQNNKGSGIRLENVPLKELFREIEEKFGYSFMYSNVDIDDSQNISVNTKSNNINEILDEAFRGQPISYEVSNQKIVLKKGAIKTSTQDKVGGRTVSGVVTDSSGEPIIGAVVKLKGSTTGTTTDIDGRYMINVNKNNDVLAFNYLGYHPQDITVGNRSKLDVELIESDQALNEVVVIGYGTLKKSDLTAAISSVSGEDLATKATTNPAEALQGAVSGVNVLKSSGLAGSDISIKIRGVNTFGSNEPLYVIDGFFGDINNLNPNDIESIEILKDGAASAIYGSVAANGVVLVTTKSGKDGRVIVDINSYASMRKTARRLELLDADGYLKVHKAMFENAGESLPSYINKPGRNEGDAPYNTNWQDEVFRTGVSLNQSVSVRGGMKDTKFTISGNITDDKGILINNKYTKHNFRSKISTKKNIFSIDATMGYMASKASKHYVPLLDVYMISPLVPVYDKESEGGYGLTNSFWPDMASNINPIANTENRKGWQKRQHFDGNIAVGVDIMKGLNYRISYGYRGNNYQDIEHARSFIADPKAPVEYPWHQEERGFWEEHILDNVLSYNNKLGEHSINAMLGTSMNKEQSTWNLVKVEGKTTVYSVENGKLVMGDVPAGFSNQDFMTINAGRGGTFSGDGTKYNYNRLSYFGRLNYSYGNRYLFQFTFRRDGSSKFGEGKRWGNFPSVALGWRINEEAFFPQETPISNLKLRGSWGRLGNEVVLGYYASHALISTGNTNWLGSVQGSGSNPWPGSIASGLENRDLRWETTESINIGLDYGFLDNKLSGTINYYDNRTKDLLIRRRLAPSAGLENPTLNVGEMKNSGFEFEINYTDKAGDFKYNAGLNLSYLKNEMTKLSDKGQIIYGYGLNRGDSHFANATMAGRPIGGFHLYETDGIFQTEEEVLAHKNANGDLLQKNAKPGDIRFRDVNGDGIIDEDDKTFQGSGMPKLEVNLNLGAAYKGFDFSALIGSGWGHKLYNGNRYFFEGMHLKSNFMTSTLNAWTPENKNTNMPRAVLGDPNGNTRESDRFLENGDFIRLRQLQLGYTLPAKITKMLRMDNLRFYVSGENLLTWTNYDGIDPEFSPTAGNTGSASLNTGLDREIFPFTRSYTFGIQLSF